MVSTRHHPRDFPPPDASPTKSRSPRKQGSRTSTASPAPDSPTMSSPDSSITLTKRAVSNSAHSAYKSASNAVAPVPPARSSSTAWSHTASNITIAWLLISLPLQIWDTLYILLRPHTMAGGALQWPIWKPYEIYVAIDRVYANPADPWGGAQGAMNAIETVLYGLYILIVLNHGVPSAGGGVQGWIAGGRKVAGRRGNIALLIGFSAAVMTFAKTVMYYFVEYFANFENIKHNDWLTLFIFYGVLNGLWIIFPAYMTVVFGSDIIDALDIAVDSPEFKKEN